jgi:negative regulator of flagellin synthesis FlgM
MKINHVIENAKTGISSPKSNGNGNPSASITDAPISSGEKLSISDLSTRLNDLESRLSLSKEFDPAKVDAIKQAIRDGQFKVSSEVVADRLVESVKQMLGK